MFRGLYRQRLKPKRSSEAGSGHPYAFHGELLLLAFDGRCGLTFAHRGRLFIEFPATGLRKDSRFLADAFEAAEGNLERLVFSDSD